MATPLAMLPTEAEKPGTDEAVSESSSTVIVGLKDKADQDDDEDKGKDDKSVPEASKAAGSKPGGTEKKEEREGDDKDKDDKKDGKDDKDKDKDEKDKDKKDGPPPNPDMAGPGPAPVGSGPSKGPDDVIHEGFSCDECKVSKVIVFMCSCGIYIQCRPIRLLDLGIIALSKCTFRLLFPLRDLTVDHN